MIRSPVYGFQFIQFHPTVKQIGPKCLFVDFNVSYFYGQIRQTKEAHSPRRILSSSQSIFLTITECKWLFLWILSNETWIDAANGDGRISYWMSCCDFNDTARAIDRVKENECFQVAFRVWKMMRRSTIIRVPLLKTFRFYRAPSTWAQAIARAINITNFLIYDMRLIHWKSESSTQPSTLRSSMKNNKMEFVWHYDTHTVVKCPNAEYCE